MPIFDFKCKCCYKITKDVYLRKFDEKVKCTRCRSEMSKLVPNKIHADVFPADGVFLEHVSAEGKRFFSKKEMKKYAKDNKLELGYL